MKDKLSVCYTSDDNYAELLGTAIYSLLHNNREIPAIDIYILDNHISSSNKEKLLSVVNTFNRQITFINVSCCLEEVMSSSAASYGGFSTYARIYIDRLLPPTVEILLYIDTDTLVLHNLADLLNFKFHNYIVAAVKDTVSELYRTGLGFSPKDSYFNTGVLLINMKRWREFCVEDKLISLLPKIAPYAEFADQDLLNLVLKHEVAVLPLKFNCMIAPLFFKPKDLYHLFHLDQDNYYELAQMENDRREPYIIHFNSGLASRPWIKGGKHPYGDNWMSIRNKIYESPLKKQLPNKKQQIIIIIANYFPYQLIYTFYLLYLYLRNFKIKARYLKRL